MIRRAGALMLIAVIGTACEYPTTTNVCDPLATADGGRVIVIPESWTIPFDALPGDRVDVLMEVVAGRDTSDVIAACDDMGGELIVNVQRMTWTCEGVDF